jgi:uncharacterized protein (TIGR02679 family)
LLPSLACEGRYTACCFRVQARSCPEVLLSQLVAAGAQLRNHGDFDWPGIAIANHVIAVFGATPWRFGAADYCAALERDARATLPLPGNAVEVCWDSALGRSMQARLLAIDEEAHAIELLADLDIRSCP